MIAGVVALLLAPAAIASLPARTPAPELATGVLGVGCFWCLEDGEDNARRGMGGALMVFGRGWTSWTCS